MKFIDLFKLSTRMFKARTSRTLLTILGMSVGIAAILFLVSFGYGLQSTLLERITTSESLLTLDVLESKSSAISINNAVLEKIRQFPGVAEVSPAFQLTSQGQIDGISSDLIAIGVKSSFLRLGGFRISKGESLSDDNQTGAIITSSVAQIFGKESAEEMLGKEVSLAFFISKDASEESAENNLQSNFNRFDLDKKIKIIGVIEGEDNIIYLNADVLSELKVDRFSQVKVKCDSQQSMNVVRDSLIEQGLVVSSLSDTVDQANKIFKIIQIVLMLFGAVALAVSAIGMFNTMTIALLERTEEIGIMKSIGASNAGVSAMFIMEATVMGFLGGIAGILLGILGGEVSNYTVNFVASKLGGEAVRLFVYPIPLVFGILAGSMVVGFITGFVPARRASNIDPLDALRYK